MSMSFEKSVKGGTKIKLAAPKSKYVEHILKATHAGEAGVAEVFRTMTNRLRDSTWTIVFKGLIIVHMMIREGAPNVTLKYIAEHPTKLAISTFSDAQDQGRNIRHYYSYIDRRGRAFRDTKTDWVRDGQGRLKRLSVDKGLLRETEIVQKQVAELLRCDLMTDPENEISLMAFRLLVMDLLKLYSVMNEGTISVLEHYFEMSKTDAERALAIYKTFTKQTDEVVQYLSTARTYEGATRLEIPKLKHAPVGLTQSLTEYLNDPDFDINRRQYLATQEAKRTGKPVQQIQKSSANGSSSSAAKSPTSSAPPKGPAPDLIDLFGSIQDNQQTMATNSQGFVSPGFAGQQSPSTNPFAAMVAQQTAQQQQPQLQQQATAYNPFGMQQQPQMQNQTGFSQQFQPQQTFSPQQSPPQQQQFATGQDFFGQQQQQQQQPFQTGMQQQSPFGQQQPQQFGQMQQQPQQTQQNPFGQPQQQQTGMNGMSQMPVAQALQPQQTSSNPFRASMMSPPVGSPASPQSTNPFARTQTGGLGSIQEGSPFTQQSGSPFGQQNAGGAANSPFSAPQQQQQQQPTPFFTGQQQQSSPFGNNSGPVAQPLQPTATGTNPFARTASPATNNSLSPQQPLVASPTGSTNPFRQSQFVNQQTGTPWQQQSQGTIGGMDLGSFQSMPVFPRPPGQGGQQQQPWP